MAPKKKPRGLVLALALFSVLVILAVSAWLYPEIFSELIGQCQRIYQQIRNP